MLESFYNSMGYLSI